MKRLILVLFLTLPATVFASPITYQFSMPAFDSGSLVGDFSLLDVTVDNGSGSIFNQSYLNTEITGLSIVSGIYSLSLNKDDHASLYEGSQAYITTDALGIATLDLSPVIDTRARFSETVCCTETLQLGTRDGSGPTQLFFQKSNGVNGNITTGVIVQGAALSAVPVPAAVWLFGTALIGFVGMSRRRKVA